MSLDNQIAMPKLLKADEVAKILNISRSLTYQLMQTGEIPTVRFGRNVRVLHKRLARIYRPMPYEWQIYQPEI